MKKIFLFSFLIYFSSPNLWGQYNSVLSQGNWYQISTNTNGVYKLDYFNLSQMGISMSNLQIEDIRLYGNGGGMLPELNSDFRHEDLQENAIKIYDSNGNGIIS